MNAACISRSVDGAEMGSGKRLTHVRPYHMPFLSNRIIPNDTNSIIVSYIICLLSLRQNTSTTLFFELFYSNILYQPSSTNQKSMEILWVRKDVLPQVPGQWAPRLVLRVASGVVFPFPSTALQQFSTLSDFEAEGIWIENIEHINMFDIASIYCNWNAMYVHKKSCII